MSPGTWGRDDSDLALEVLQVYHKSDTNGYYKIKGFLFNKKSKTFYEKCNKCLIKHRMKRIKV